MLPIFFFIFSAVLLFSMITYRLWELKAGRFNLEEVAARELTPPHVHIETLNNKFLEVMRHFIHFAIVLLVRGAIGVLFVVRRESKRLSTKLDQFFLHGNGLDNKGSVSFFLRDISKHKARLKKFVPPGKETDNH
ncbi:MAG: hypothetical protein AAB862_01755 [Patescibacteria group bacterium]